MWASLASTETSVSTDLEPKADSDDLTAAASHYDYYDYYRPNHQHHHHHHHHHGGYRRPSYYYGSAYNGYYNGYYNGKFHSMQIRQSLHAPNSFSIFSHFQVTISVPEIRIIVHTDKFHDQFFVKINKKFEFH